MNEATTKRRRDEGTARRDTRRRGRIGHEMLALAIVGAIIGATPRATWASSASPEAAPSTSPPAASDPFQAAPVDASTTSSTEAPSPAPPDQAAAAEPTTTAPPPPVPLAVAEQACAHVPDDLDHQTERAACLQAVGAPAKAVVSPRPRELDTERPELRRDSRARDAERGEVLEGRGRGLVAAGVASFIMGAVLVGVGTVVQRQDDAKYVAESSTSLDPYAPLPEHRTRGLALTIVGAIAMLPLAHGLTIPGAFCWARGKNLQRRALAGRRWWRAG